MLSVIVPCFNEQDNIGLFYGEAMKAFDGLGCAYEFVFVNDGSSDNTLSKLRGLCETNDGHSIKVVSFSRNFGKEAAIFAGLNECSGDFALLIDADMQQRPEVGCEMYRTLMTNPEYDCVTAYQQERKEGAVLAFFKNSFYKIINRIADTRFVSGASDFRLLNRKMIDAVLSVKEYHRFSKGIFSWVGFNTFYMPYQVEKRAHGKTSWSFYKLFKYAVEGIVGFTTAPLKIAMVAGLVSAALSALYSVAVIIQKLAFGIDVPGYATIVVLLLFLGGMQLFCLGLLGEYISKIYIQVKDRPVYIIKEVITNDKKD